MDVLLPKDFKRPLSMLHDIESRQFLLCQRPDMEVNGILYLDPAHVNLIDELFY